MLSWSLLSLWYLTHLSVLLKVKANFGTEEFVADFESLWSEQCNRIVKGINVTGIPALV